MDQLLELSNLCNVASQIDAEIRALSVRNTAAVRALRRQYTRQLKRPTQYLSSIWPGLSSVCGRLIRPEMKGQPRHIYETCWNTLAFQSRWSKPSRAAPTL